MHPAENSRDILIGEAEESGADAVTGVGYQASSVPQDNSGVPARGAAVRFI